MASYISCSLFREPFVQDLILISINIGVMHLGDVGQRTSLKLVMASLYQSAPLQKIFLPRSMHTVLRMRASWNQDVINCQPSVCFHKLQNNDNDSWRPNQGMCQVVDITNCTFISGELMVHLFWESQTDGFYLGMCIDKQLLQLVPEKSGFDKTDHVICDSLGIS